MSKASVVSIGTDHMRADLMTKELVSSSWDRHVRALYGEFDVSKLVVRGVYRAGSPWSISCW